MLVTPAPPAQAAGPLDVEAVIDEMSEKMRLKEGDDDRTVLSKKLSYVLRHGAKELGLNVDDGGFVSVSALLAVEPLFGGVPLEALVEIVEQSNMLKQRYELVLRDGDYLIRATGKHTMTGLQRERKGGSSSSGAGGRRGRGEAGGQRRQSAPMPVLDEDEFCARWRLDRLARLRLGELAPASRQMAMQRFCPGPQVPASDFPKVFVAFCKRFRNPRGKETALGMPDGVEFEEEGFDVPGHGQRAAAPSAKSRGKKGKAYKGREEHEGLVPWRDEGVTRRMEAEDDFDASNLFMSYPSPGSSPRSLSGRSFPPPMMSMSQFAPASPQDSGVLDPSQAPPPPAPHALQQLHAQQGPPRGSGRPPPLNTHLFSGASANGVSSPGACGVGGMSSPGACGVGGMRMPPVAPPPPAYPPKGMPVLPMGMSKAPRAPPPPTHAPQVMGVGSMPYSHGEHDQAFQDFVAHTHHQTWAGLGTRPCNAGYPEGGGYAVNSPQRGPPPPPAAPPSSPPYHESFELARGHGSFDSVGHMAMGSQSADMQAFAPFQHSPAGRHSPGHGFAGHEVYSSFSPSASAKHPGMNEANNVGPEAYSMFPHTGAAARHNDLSDMVPGGCYPGAFVMMHQSERQ